MKNNVIKFTKPEITPEILALFRKGLAIIEVDGDLKWEDEGGQRGAFFDIEIALDRALGRTKPWHINPLATYYKPVGERLPERWREFNIACRLRDELEEALDKEDALVDRQ
jgi:hypothetical protein